MDWNLYWTIIWQVVLACVILALPISMLGFLVTSAVETASRRPSDTKKVISSGR